MKHKKYKCYFYIPGPLSWSLSDSSITRASSYKCTVQCRTPCVSFFLCHPNAKYHTTLVTCAHQATTLNSALICATVLWFHHIIIVLNKAQMFYAGTRRLWIPALIAFSFYLVVFVLLEMFDLVGSCHFHSICAESDFDELPPRVSCGKPGARSFPQYAIWPIPLVSTYWRHSLGWPDRDHLACHG